MGTVPAFVYAEHELPKELPKGERVICLFQEGTSYPGAAAFHTEYIGDDPDTVEIEKKGELAIQVDVSAALDRGGSVFSAQNVEYDSVLKLIDHEIKETVWDPFICRWVVDDEHGIAIADECCDAVQGISIVDENIYIPANDTKVNAFYSNHCLPRWGDPYAPSDSQFDSLWLLKSPISLSKFGYMTLRSINDDYKLRFGKERLAGYRLENKDFPFYEYGESFPEHKKVSHKRNEKRIDRYLKQFQRDTVHTTEDI